MRSLKHILLLVIVPLSIGYVKAQEIAWETDYIARYLLVKEGDTLEISLDKAGKYLYSESHLLTALLSSSFKEIIPPGTNISKSAVLVNLSKLELLMHMQSGRSVISANLDMTHLSQDKKSEKIDILRANALEEDITLGDKTYPLYALELASNADDNPIAAFDKKYPMNYDLFGDMLKVFIGTQINMELPPGILVYFASPKGDALLELIDIRKKKRKGHLNSTIIFD